MHLVHVRLGRVFLLLLTGFPAPPEIETPCPISNAHAPAPPAVGPGTGDSSSGGRSIGLGFTVPPPRRDTQTDLNRSEQIWVDQEVGGLSKLPGAEGEIRTGHRALDSPQLRGPPQLRLDGWMLPVLLGQGRRSSAISSGFDLCRCRGLRGRESEQHCTAPSTQLGHLALMPRFMTDLGGQRRRGG
jgi:hypothetical protein